MRTVLQVIRRELRFRGEWWIVMGVVALFVLLRLPSLVEPYWYKDEGIYQVIGKALNSGRMLYVDIWDNKPPLLYLVYAIFNGDQFAVRLFSLIIGACSVVAFYVLAKRLLNKPLSVLLALIVYTVLFATPILEGNIANAENFMHLPILISALLVLRFIQTKHPLTIFLAGFALSVAFMIKTVGIFEFAAFGIFLFLSHTDTIRLRRFTQLVGWRHLRAESIFFLGFVSLLVVSSFYFFIHGAFLDFLSGVFAENVGYVNTKNELFIPMGILLGKVALLIGAVWFIVARRRSIGGNGVLVLLWVVFALFSTFFSQRPYVHYVLMVMLPFSLFIGLVFDSKKHRLLYGSMAIAIVILVVASFPIYREIKRLGGYYVNYAAFLDGRKTVEEYQAFFDVETPRDYELSRFIEMFSKDRNDVFLWSDSGQIYALSDTLPPGRYIVAYHIIQYDGAIEETVRSIDETRPTFIIKTRDSEEIQKFLPHYSLKYKISGAYIYEREH